MPKLRNQTPSTERKVPWIWVRNPQDTENFETGKWLIFGRSDQIDDFWNEVSAACRQGLLWQAKVSTRHSFHDGNPDKYVICVYTPNSANRIDVLHYREILRQIGFTETLSYKSDAMTASKQRGSLYRA